MADQEILFDTTGKRETKKTVNKNKKQENKTEEVLSFEKGIERLEQVVNELDQNNLPLEQALERFQQGIQLVKNCNRLLDLAEDKVKVLMDDSKKEVMSDNV